MSVSWDLNIGALITLTVALVGMLRYVFAVDARAQLAVTKAAEAAAEAQRARDALALHVAAFASYREVVAQTYISRETMREVEERLTVAINRLGDRLDAMMKRSS